MYACSGVPIYPHPSLAGSLRINRSPDRKELPAMSDSELKFHYSNPKFVGLPWGIDLQRKANQKTKRKHHRHRKAKRKLHNPHAQECRARLDIFWKEFSALPNTAMRLEYLRRASRPPWKRVSDEIRKRLRRQFAAKYPFLLTSIDEYCGACGDGVWKEKHHIIPLSHGGINEDL